MLAVTGSPAKAGVVGFAQTLPYVLFYLPAGALVDRWNRKHVMLVSDAGRALAMASVGLALVLGGLTLTQVVLVVFIEGSLFVCLTVTSAPNAEPQRAVHQGGRVLVPYNHQPWDLTVSSRVLASAVRRGGP